MRTFNILLLIVIIAASSCSRLSTRNTNKIEIDKIKEYGRNAIKELLDLANGQKEKVVNFVAKNKDHLGDFVLETNKQLDEYIDDALERVEEIRDMKDFYLQFAANAIREKADIKVIDSLIAPK